MVTSYGPQMHSDFAEGQKEAAVRVLRTSELAVLPTVAVQIHRAWMPSFPAVRCPSRAGRPCCRTVQQPRLAPAAW